MKLTDEKIKEIAENLECGMKCYYHQKTGDLLMMPDFNAGHDTEFWEDQIEELEEN